MPADIPLDFVRKGMCGGVRRATPMTCAVNDDTIRSFLSNIRERLDN